MQRSVTAGTHARVMQRALARRRPAFEGLVITIVALAVFALAAAFTTKIAADAAAGAIAAGAQVAAAVARLQAAEQTVLTLTAVISGGGLLFLGIALTILRRNEDRTNRTISAELDRVKHASLTDYLTGLGNHRAYQDDLVRNVAECWSDGAVLTIAMVDVDGLRDVNNRSGYVSGDRLLATLARVLRTADLQSIPYRLGGDEFALAFPGMPAPVARARMEQVRSTVEAQLGGTTVSIGLATMSLADPDLLVVREQASAALDEAKHRGRNTVVAFDEIRDDQQPFVPERIAAVRELILSGRMGVAFQPIWNIGDGRLIGYEALARPGGDHPVSPADAFSIAERIGKAHDLDRVCRDAIFEQAKSLPPGVLLFLNVSPQSLDRDEFDGTALVRTAEAAGLAPERVVLEIPARSTVRLDLVIREAARLRRLGFGLAIDGTGCGQAGLELLSQLTVDYIKVDKDVLARAALGSGGRGILAGIVAIAREMHATIIAAGIENSAMLELVRSATRSSPTDTAAQGYYLGRPAAGFAHGDTALQPAANGVTSVR